MAPGMCASSNCSVVRASTRIAPSAIATSTARGESGVGAPSSSVNGPRLSATTRSAFGGRSPRLETASATKLGLGFEAQRAVVLALERDRRGGLVVDAGAAAHRSAEVARPDLDAARELEQPVVERVVERGRPVARLDRQIRPGDVAHEQRVAAQQGDRPVAAAAVADEEGGVLGAVARRVDRLDLHLPQIEPPAVGDHLVGIVDAGQLVDVDRRPRGPRQAPVTRDVVGMVVGLEHVLDPHVVQARQPQVGLDVPLRIDDRSDPGPDVGDQVRGAAEVLVDHLPEEHRRP